VTKSILGLPVAVLTNSSLMPREVVRQRLARADVVVAKLDAPTDGLFRMINRPYVSYSLDEIVQGIARFRHDFKGKLALQMMFISENKGFTSDMARTAWDLSPDEVQLNTPLRPCAVPSLPPEEMGNIRRAFSLFENVLTVYEALRPEVLPLNAEETRWRRPEERAMR
jgi:wyosine [tRNA(Phe)-imidazoG37] synthetase (radical SAM superfamily)